MKMKKTATFLLALSLVMNLFAMPVTAANGQLPQDEDGLTTTVTQEEMDILSEEELDPLPTERPWPSETVVPEDGAGADRSGENEAGVSMEKEGSSGTLIRQPEGENYAEVKEIPFGVEGNSLTRAVENNIIGSGWAGVAGDNIIWELTADGVLSMTGEGDMSAFAIPEQYKDAIRHIIIGTGITSIGRYVFSSCRRLEKMELPDTIIKIEEGAFSYCDSLTEIKLPTGVTEIGDSAFSACVNLMFVELPAELKSIGVNAFCGCTSLELTVLPSKITTIKGGAFSACTNLALTELPASLTTIEQYAFSGCTNLGMLELHDGITTIEECAFSGCTNLAISKLPNKLTSIPRYAFANCENLGMLELPDGITTIEECAFLNCPNLDIPKLPDELTYIGNDAFNYCLNLTISKLPDKLSHIEYNAFITCMNLQLTELPEKLTYIGRNAFNSCSNLSLSELPAELTYIGDNAFHGCTNVVLTELPENVTFIGDNAFRYTNWIVSFEHYVQTLDGDYSLKKTTSGVEGTNGTSTIPFEYFENYHAASHKDEILSKEIGEYIPYGGAITLRRYYDLDTLKITLNPENGGESITQDVPYGGSIIAPKAPEKPGYTFDGWKDQFGGAYNFDSPVTAAVTLTATWIARSDTPYQVKHYQQTADGSSYELKDTENLTTTTDAFATATVKSYKGFHENTAAKDRMPAGSVAGNGSLILALYYDRDTITVNIDGGSGESVPQEILYGGTIPEPEEPQKPGYTFDGWKDQNGQRFDLDTPVTEEISLSPIWIVKGDTPYRVEHYLQNLTCDGYELKETDKLAAATDSLVEAVAKVYPGFHVVPTHLSRIAAGTVTGDGSLVLSLYYDRDIITVSFDAGNGEPMTEEIPYGSKVSEPEALNKPGYSFGGWKDENGQRFDFSAPVTEEVTLSPIWTVNGDTPYQVKHYQQTVVGDAYVLLETEDLTAATDSAVEAVAKGYTGFHMAADHPDQVTSGTVAGDGTLTLAIYYDRDQFSVTVNMDENDFTEAVEQTILYGGMAVEPEAPTKAGYIFDGWQDEAGNKFLFSDPITRNLVLSPCWKIKNTSGGSSHRDPAPDSDKNQEEAFLESDIPLTGIIFDDVLPGDTFYDDVMDAYHAGYMEGITATTFEPDSPLTRAQAAYTFTKMFGANLEGLEITGDFEDVTRDTQYAEFITWANNAGVEIGYGNGSFGPTDGITREQLALMLYRAYGEHADVAAWTEEFFDVDDVSIWSETAVRWAVSMDLLKGNAGHLSPKGTVTRAEAAVLIQAVMLLETGITK